MDNLKDIMYTHYHLDIRLLGVHHITAFWEPHQLVAADIIRMVGVVLVAQTAPEGVDSDILTPLQMTDEGDTVEDLTVEVPREHHRHVAVVKELHVVDEVEHLLLDDKRGVGDRVNQQRVGHLVPLISRLEEEVCLSPAVKPETLVELCLGEVVCVVATKDITESHGVAQTQRRGILVDGDTTLLVVDICLIGGIA